MEPLTNSHLEGACCRALNRMANRNVARDDAEDAVQDAVVRHCSYGKRGGTAVPPETEHDLVFWLVRVARNRLCDGYRHVAALPCVSLCEDDAMAFTGQDVAEQVPLQMAVRQAWEGLRDTDRAALQLRAEGKSCQEAASALGVSVDTYKTRVHRAKERFAELLIENGLDDPRERKSDCAVRNRYKDSIVAEDSACVSQDCADDMD